MNYVTDTPIKDPALRKAWIEDDDPIRQGSNAAAIMIMKYVQHLVKEYDAQGCGIWGRIDGHDCFRQIIEGQFKREMLLRSDQSLLD